MDHPGAQRAIWPAQTGLVTGGRTILLHDRPGQVLSLKGAWGSPLVHDLSASVDGTRLCATTTGGQAVVWDTLVPDAPPRVLEQQGQGPLVHAWSADGRQLVTGSDLHGLRVFDALTGARLERWPHLRTTALLWPEPDTWILGTSGGELQQVVRDTGQVRASNALAVGQAIVRLDQGPDGLLALTDRGDVHLCDPQGMPRLTLRVDAVAARIAPNGRWVAVVLRGGAVVIYEGATPLVTLPPFRDVVFDLAWSPDSRQLAVVQRDRFVRRFTFDGTRLLPWGHLDEVRALVFVDGGRRLATICTRMLWVWDTQTGEPLVGALGDAGAAWLDVAAAPDDRHLLVGVGHGSLRVFDGHTGAEVRRLPIAADRIAVGGGRVFCAESGVTVLSWPALEVEATLETDRVLGLSADGDRLAVSVYGSTTVQGLEDGTVRRTLSQRRSDSAAWGPDVLVLADSVYRVALAWDLRRAHSLMAQLGEPGWLWQQSVHGVAGHGGRVFAARPGLGIWEIDPTTGAPLTQLSDAGAAPLAVHPDGTTLACALEHAALLVPIPSVGD